MGSIMAITGDQEALVQAVILNPFFKGFELVWSHATKTARMDKRSMGQIHKCLQNAQPMGLPNNPAFQGAPAWISGLRNRTNCG